MTTTPDSTSSSPSNVFVDAAWLGARYGRGRTYISDLVNGPAFPGSIVAGRWRLDHVLAYEAA